MACGRKGHQIRAALIVMDHSAIEITTRMFDPNRPSRRPPRPTERPAERVQTDRSIQGVTRSSSPPFRRTRLVSREANFLLLLLHPPSTSSPHASRRSYFPGSAHSRPETGRSVCRPSGRSLSGGKHGGAAAPAVEWTRPHYEGHRDHASSTARPCGQNSADRNPPEPRTASRRPAQPRSPGVASGPRRLEADHQREGTAQRCTLAWAPGEPRDTVIAAGESFVDRGWGSDRA